jgi:hypothetical protein
MRTEATRRKKVSVEVAAVAGAGAADARTTVAKRIMTVRLIATLTVRAMLMVARGAVEDAVERTTLMAAKGNSSRKAGAVKESIIRMTRILKNARAVEAATTMSVRA